MSDIIELEIKPRKRDLGGFEVMRVLPFAKRQMVGPFIFFDQMGPNNLKAGHGIDVRPHPHIGLSTVTYLFDGELMHRDSLGTALQILPGEVNWMTAGKGIVHSERTSDEYRDKEFNLFGIQAWVALPKSHEETEPAFANYTTDVLPQIEEPGVTARVITGTLFGETSPVETHWETVYADVAMNVGASIPFDADAEERAVYLVEGCIEIDGTEVEAGTMAVLKPGEAATIKAGAPSRLMLLGGAAMDGPRYIWLNLVSSDKERIEQAKADWQAGKFDPVPDETEFIPLPDTPGP